MAAEKVRCERECIARSVPARSGAATGVGRAYKTAGRRFTPRPSRNTTAGESRRTSGREYPEDRKDLLNRRLQKPATVLRRNLMADEQINQIRREATRAIDAVQNDRDLRPEAPWARIDERGPQALGSTRSRA
jgi:hypothetical protein